MRKIEKFEAITGEVFDNIKVCEAVEKEWNDAYELIKEMTFYNWEKEVITLPELEDIFKSPEQTEFMNGTMYFTIPSSDSEELFYMRKTAYRKFLSWFGFSDKISDEFSDYKTWYYDENNDKFVPIDAEFKKAIKLINLVRNATGLLIL